jgi:PucR C-terminal helix-turn-helix domain/GGDEF-like domain
MPSRDGTGPSGKRAAPSGDIDLQVSEIGAELGRRVEELGREIAATIRSTIDFYKNTRVISDEELLTHCTENIRFLFDGLQHSGRPFDTSPAMATGSERAAQGAPLPAVMDAFRVGVHYAWDAMSDLASWQPDRISRQALIRATERIWQAQEQYTNAMSNAYRQQAMQQILEDEAERAALTEALLWGRIFDARSLWEIAQLLRLPQRGPYIVIAAKTPATGKQALGGIAGKLSSVDVSSAWRLQLDLQIGIAHIGPKTAHEALLQLLSRVATTPVGVSPPFDNLADTAQALRYAQIALNARDASGGNVTVFDDSVLGVAAVSAPEVTRKLADIILSPFDDMPADDKDTLFETFRAWVDHGGSLPETAAALYCHPNTVRYRLHRIEQRSGRSMTDPRELAELCLALEVYKRLR